MSLLKVKVVRGITICAQKKEKNEGKEKVQAEKNNGK